MTNKVQSLGSAGSAVALSLISGATNATPIVVTLAANHGLKNDDRIAIAGITGNTGANGVWQLSNVGATTATLNGSVGNGTYGGTPRVGIVFDKTPHMKQHSMNLATSGNLVGTVDFENYASYTDFANGQNVDTGGTAPILSPGVQGITNSAGSVSTPAKSTVVFAATNSGAEYEIKPSYIMRAVVTAYTSGTIASAVTS